ncbi:LysR substrate-binding domain-containing protein [Chania multitudinisentens]|uniref:LysR substrate-binding domain-containing protein n=1 Tax=Chania multitudinisentens TaxID=1639108 RepID=UPI00068793D3|nr:LysR substrate-binding domain-containing protein [Chania multitudinisentens]
MDEKDKIFMRNLPKPNQLKMFQSIIEHGSFRAAAKALHQTQPALTQSMNELEKMLGTQLMIRGPRGVVLTDAGKLFEPRVQLILKELERAVTETKQFSAASRGTIELGSSSLPFFTMLPPAILRFQKRFPQISINITEGQISELLPALRAGKLDFIIGAASSEDIISSEFIEEPFFTAPFGILAHREHPLAQSHSLQQLQGAKWYLPTSQLGYYNQLDTFLFPEGKQSPQMVIRGGTAIMAIQMVLNAGFLTVAAKETLRVPYLNQLLCTIPISEPLPDASYSFIYSRRLPLTQVARKMMDKLLWECKNYPWYEENEAKPAFLTSTP